MAAQNAIQNPLLDEVSLKGAKAVLVNVTGGLDMTLLEVDEAANAITDQVDPEANVIFGAAFDPALEGSIRVSVVATGMDGASIAAIEPQRTMRVNATAKPLIVEQAAPAPAPVAETFAQPAAYEPARAAEPAPTPSWAAPEPQVIQPAMSMDVQQADLAFEEPAPVAAATPAPEPVIQTTAARTVIVDPLVAEDEDFDAPLYAETPFTDSRQQRKGFLSLFGGRPQQQQPRTEGGMPRALGRSSTAAQPIEEPQVDESEDLEIPSFLRRLAN
jgi:cell division protein FtsZ